MTNEIAELETQIETLWNAYDTLSAEKHAIIEKYERPTQWIKDEKYIQIGKEREVVLSQIGNLVDKIQDIKEAKIFTEKLWEQ